MHDVIESAGAVESATKFGVTQGNTPEMRRPPRSIPSQQPRRVQERWRSSLAPADLDALLGILENELIPRLVSGYAPAHHAPLATSRSST